VKKFFKRILPIALIILFGCSPYTINYDYNTELDFGGYRTFNFIPDPKDKQRSNEGVRSRIRVAITRELQKKEMLFVPENPQILIAILTNVDRKRELIEWGYTFGPEYKYWRGPSYWGTESTDVKEYDEGNLIVDFVDAITHELFWRGGVEGVLPKNPAPDEVEVIIKEVVAEILKYYPPKK
jgi:hypothetical protein